MSDSYSTSNAEKGNILLYAVIVITFLTGLTVYLKEISSPVFFQSSDTKQLIQIDSIAESASNIFIFAIDSDLDLCQKIKDIPLTSATSNTFKNYLDKYSTINMTIGNTNYEIVNSFDSIDFSYTDNYYFTAHVKSTIRFNNTKAYRKFSYTSIYGHNKNCTDKQN